MSDQHDTQGWDFLTPAEFFEQARNSLEVEEIRDDIERITTALGCSKDVILADALGLLMAIHMSLPPDVHQGLDTIRADPAQRLAVPSLRDLILHLLQLPIDDQG